MRSLKEGIEAGSASSRPTSNRPMAVKARSFMTKDVVALRETQTLSEALEVLVGKKLSGAPVLDERRRLVGIISEFDCMKVVIASSFHQEGRPGQRLVKELMTRDLHGVSPDTDLYTIAHIFIAHRIRRVPVLEFGDLVGIVSRRDVLRVMRDLVN